MRNFAVLRSLRTAIAWYAFLLHLLLAGLVALVARAVQPGQLWLVAGGAAVLSGLATWLVVHRQLQPLGQLRTVVEEIRRGAQPIAAVHCTRDDELGELSRAFHALLEQKRNVELDLQRVASTDPLTGIHNRRHLEAMLKAELAKLQRTRGTLTLAYLDLDMFKEINDSHGHSAGDAILIEFARRLSNSVRCTDIVARIAGDEFVVLFGGLACRSEALRLGQKILRNVAAPVAYREQILTVTTSIGIAMTDHPDTSWDQMLSAADQALYAAKSGGRNRCHVVQLIAAQPQPASAAASKVSKTNVVLRMHV